MQPIKIFETGEVVKKNAVTEKIRNNCKFHPRGKDF